MKHTVPMAFPFEILHFIKKNMKLPLLKNLHFPTEKNRTAAVFMQEYKQKQFRNPWKISYKCALRFFF